MIGIADISILQNVAVDVDHEAAAQRISPGYIKFKHASLV